VALDDDLQLAFDVADQAGLLALEHFRTGLEVTPKIDGSPVTEADRAVERLLLAMLGAARPDDAFLGEEFGRRGDASRVWILDPIDGTAFFVRDDPNWRIHLALQVEGVVELAVVTSPALGRRWWATRGGGAFEGSWPTSDAEPRRLSVSSVSTVEESAIAAIESPSRDRLPEGGRQAPTSPLHVVDLVRGDLDVFLAERYFVWDHAPWILIVQEAGGRFTDPTGGAAADRGGGLYSNAALHELLVAALGYPTTESEPTC
jgi:histidinol-phosphatase